MKKQIHKAFYARDYEEGLRRGRQLVEEYQDRYRLWSRRTDRLACGKKEGWTWAGVGAWHYLAKV